VTIRGKPRDDVRSGLHGIHAGIVRRGDDTPPADLGGAGCLPRGRVLRRPDRPVPRDRTAGFVA